MNAPMVRGNHDRACAGLSDLKEFNPVAALSAYWTKNTLNPEYLEWLRALPQGPLRRDDLPGMEFVHGSPLDEDEYLLNTASADDNLELPGHAPLIFFGHTHIQGGFVDEDGESRPFRPDLRQPGWTGTVHECGLTPGERYLINPGSVGQPRDNDWRAAFAVFEHNGGPLASVTFYRVPYDIQVNTAADSVGATCRIDWRRDCSSAASSDSFNCTLGAAQRSESWTKLVACRIRPFPEKTELSQ